MSKTLVKLIEFVVIVSCHSVLFAAEAKRLPEWEKIVAAAKKEGKIVIAIPPAAELRKAVPELLAANKCPDFIEDKGHSFGTDLAENDKRALIEYLKGL